MCALLTDPIRDVGRKMLDFAMSEAISLIAPFIAFDYHILRVLWRGRHQLVLDPREATKK